MPIFLEDGKISILHAGIALTGIGTACVLYGVYSRQTVPISTSNEDLKKEIVQLRREIAEIRNEVPKSLDNLKTTVEELKELINSKTFSSSRSNASFRTAWSDDEDDITRDFVTSINETNSQLQLTVNEEEIKQQKLLTLCENVDELYTNGSIDNRENAMRMLQDNEIEFKDDCQFLWRLGRSHIGAYEVCTSYEEKKTHAEAAMGYIQKSLDLNNESADIHKWYAISLGTMTDFISTKEKIENGYKLREHVELALKYSPEEPILYFMMGRWCWGVYMLTWIERKVASTLFATPPTATIDDALQNFLKAEKISPGFYKSNQLYIGKCYYELKQYPDARKWFQSAKEIEVVTKDDETAHAEVLQFLAKY